MNIAGYLDQVRSAYESGDATEPAQKWLNELRGRSLSWEDIGHYQKIVKILVETDRVMKEIELPLD